MKYYIPMMVVQEIMQVQHGSNIEVTCYYSSHHSPTEKRWWYRFRWCNGHDDDLLPESSQKPKTAESNPHPSGGLNQRSAIEYTLHHLQQHNRIRPSSRSYHGPATDYHAVSLVKRTEQGHQIMAAATQKRRLMIGMIVWQLCRRSWMQWGNRPTWWIMIMSGNYALLLVGLTGGGEGRSSSLG